MALTITNLTQVNADFTRYAKRVDQSNRGTIREYLMKIVNTAKSVLYTKVHANPTGKWTGDLSKSITFEAKKTSGTVFIEGDGEPYADFVEGGHHSFPGYWFLKEATKEHEDNFLQEVKNNLKVK